MRVGFSQGLPCVGMRDTKEVLAVLPELKGPEVSELPNWVRVLGPNLPYTTSAMLEFETLLRAEGDALPLRALAMLAVSNRLQCEYGVSRGRYDLQRSGKSTEWVQTIDGKRLDVLSPLEKKVYLLAEALTSSPKEVTNEQVASLAKEIGEEELVAIVIAIGYANMLDRLAMALQLPIDSPEAMQRVEWRFAATDPTGAETIAAERPGIPQNSQVAEFHEPMIHWKELAADALISELDKQRASKPRISIPTWEEIQTRLPPGLYKDPIRIRWSRVVVGHQPQLGPAWIKCLRVFEMEARQDRVFEESVFWVVTRGLRCFYCMGHCEMLMEVGGLDRQSIRDRTERLASGEWGSFAPFERAAFEYAYKLTYQPEGITCQDFKRLSGALGEKRALDCLWWIARCHLMTKVSDGFQLQLESENVFMDRNHPEAKSE